MDLFLEETIQDLFKLHLQGRDECSIKLALNKWNKDSKSLKQNSGPKCNEKAIERIYQGNRLFAIFPFSTDKLLEIYTEAIAYALNDSLELAKAYGNRSAVLSNARLYEDSLIDIDRALALNYPDNLKAKLYARKARNLSAISPEKLPEIEAAIADTRHWMMKMNDADKKHLELRLNDLSAQRSFPNPFKKADNNLITPDILDPNEKLIGASSTIELKYSKQFGRHFVATRDIKAGETLIKQKSYASIIHRSDDTNHRLLYCWNCLKRAWTSVPCNHCTCIVFCDKHCRDEAWNNYHDIECPILSYVVRPDCYIDIVLMGLRLTIKALKEAGSIGSLKDKLQKLDSDSDPLTRGFTDEKLDGTKYASIYTLTPDTYGNHEPNIYVPWIINSALVLFVWAITLNTFENGVDNMRQLINNKTAIFIGKFLMKNVRICSINMQVANIYNDVELTTRRALLSSLIGLINHSCDPNACLVYSDDVIIINTIQMIKKGEQIFVNYAQDDGIKLITPTVQHVYIKDRFNFECECDICRESLDPHYPLAKSFKDQQLPIQAKQVLDMKLIQFDKELRKARSLDKFKKIEVTDLSYVVHLLDVLNTFGKNVYNPCKEIRTFKLFLIRNYIYNSV